MVHCVGSGLKRVKVDTKSWPLDLKSAGFSKMTDFIVIYAVYI